MLVGDKGFDGLVIKIEIKGIEEVVGLCVAGAGERWDALVEYSVQKNLWGIENLSGFSMDDVKVFYNHLPISSNICGVRNRIFN